MRKALLLIFLLVFNSCCSVAAQAAGTEDGLEEVVLQLKWQHQFQFAGYYAAVVKGFYREAGLKVILKERKPGIAIADELVFGRAQFAVEMPGLLLERQAGKPVVVLAAILQHSPEVVIARKDTGIASPHDLIGKRLMLMPHGNFETRAMFSHEGIRSTDLTILDHSWDIEDLISGRVDAQSGYLTDMPYVLEKRGIAYTLLFPINYGIDFYGDCLYTSSREMREHPERVRAFLEASLRGWQYAMEHPEEMIDIILEHYSTRLSRETLRYEAEKVRELMLPRFIQIGHMNPGRWRRIADTFVELGMLSADFPLDDFIYSPDKAAERPYLRLILPVLATAMLLVAFVALLLFTFNLKLKKSVQERTMELAMGEQRFREIFNSTSDALFIHDPVTGQLRDVNETMLKMYGCTREEALSRQLQDFSVGRPPYSQDDARKWLQKTLTEGPQVFEWHARRKNGELFWVEVSLKKSTIAGEDSILASVRDITDRRRLETELRQAQKMEAIGTLAGGIAHDFNNILTAIFGYLELAMFRGAKDATLLNHLEKAHLGAVRARDLVRQILAFSRKAEQSKRPLKLVDIISEVVSLLRSTIPASIEIRQDFRSEALVYADETQMHQVILNLCTNAYHAMEHTGGILTLALHDVAVDSDHPQPGITLDPGRYVRIMVRDTGSGMDEKTMAKIFEPYFTSKEHGKGTGLGMAVVHGIIKDCRGEIVVESAEGHGSTFTIYLPVHGARAIAGREPQAEQVDCRGDAQIMVVDDEETIRELVSAFLGQEGYIVEAFENGFAAWDLLSRDPERWDLLISDMTMPGMGGLELVRRVREIRPELPVILCTGYSKDMNEVEKKNELGIGMFLQKPLTRDELLQAVCSVLQKT
ncbi:hypothetical protein GF1_12970 [Desulfolithobacter dissulfuricans]|uniref:histidine kinase n=1 Tax=Desulfolithobacter dissulfuricans TaxID=2795293 RepID=A0A915XKZ2_9BACT|nr:ABC transporter substrate-binding protein [Desulfolithobacter dissulfuricans]BCO08921.1 hypothetical protein GF1_12970 [Desulfolithobacter dissulfuricans]